MTKQKIVVLFSIAFLSINAFAQSYNEQFMQLFQEGDTLALRALLDQWEKVGMDDPDLYIADFNYYAIFSEKEVLTLGQEPKGDDYLELMNEDSTSDEAAGFLYSDLYYDTEMLRQSFGWIERGIEKFPTRLDMRFGEIYMLGKVEDYEKFTARIIEILDYSDAIKNQWTWSGGEPLEDPQNFMMSSIQDYQVQLYESGYEEPLDYMVRIAETVLKYYPNNVPSMSNIAVVLMIREQYPAALVQLLAAEKVDPTDPIILGNIAHAYAQMGDVKNAIDYYERTITYSNEVEAGYCREQIEELKRK